MYSARVFTAHEVQFVNSSSVHVLWTGLCALRCTAAIKTLKRFLCIFAHVRGVDGSCAEHLTVESYTVFICQQSYLLLFGILSRTHSFIPGLKPSFSANPSHCSPSFLLKYSLHRFPGLFTVISEHICFLLLVFLFLQFYLSVPCGRLSWLMLAFERTLK